MYGVTIKTTGSVKHSVRNKEGKEVSYKELLEQFKVAMRWQVCKRFDEFKTEFVEKLSHDNVDELQKKVNQGTELVCDILAWTDDLKRLETKINQTKNDKVRKFLEKRKETTERIIKEFLFDDKKCFKQIHLAMRILSDI